jgi:Xaa-Pro aminopeptidase
VGVTQAGLMNFQLFQEKAKESKVDAIVAVCGKSVTYLSGAGLPGTLGRLQDFPHTPRMNIVVWPTGGSPTLIVTALAERVAQRDGWIENLRVYKEYVESPMRVLGAVLRDRGLSKARIGIEKRYLGAVHWDELREQLPSAEFIDIADVLESVRNIKTDVEIRLLKKAADMQDEALLEAFANARAGHAERDVHANIISSLLRRGAQSAHGILRTSSNRVYYGGESSAPLQPGDIIQCDYVSYVDNYAANLSRVAVVGEPSSEQRSIYADLLAIHRRGVATMLKPGVRARDVFRFVESEMTSAGYSKPVGLVGHSVGLVWHQEEPILSEVEDRELRAGMVICFEPEITDYAIQDEILISDKGPQLLSDRFDTNQMFVIQE